MTVWTFHVNKEYRHSCWLLCELYITGSFSERFDNKDESFNLSGAEIQEREVQGPPLLQAVSHPTPPS